MTCIKFFHAKKEGSSKLIPVALVSVCQKALSRAISTHIHDRCVHFLAPAQRACRGGGRNGVMEAALMNEAVVLDAKASRRNLGIL